MMERCIVHNRYRLWLRPLSTVLEKLLDKRFEELSISRPWKKCGIPRHRLAYTLAVSGSAGHDETWIFGLVSHRVVPSRFADILHAYHIPIRQRKLTGRSETGIAYAGRNPVVQDSAILLFAGLSFLSNLRLQVRVWDWRANSIYQIHPVRKQPFLQHIGPGFQQGDHEGHLASQE